MFAVHGVVVASWTAHIPILKRSLGMTDLTLGGVAFAGAVAAVAGTILAARLVRSVGDRNVTRLGLGASAVAGLLIPASSSSQQLAITLGLWAMALGMADVAINTQGGAVERSARRSLLSGMHARWSVGALVGALLGTVTVASGASLLVQNTGLAVLLPAFVWPATRAFLQPIPEQIPSTAMRTRRFTHRTLGLGLVVAAASLCEGASADWAPVLLDQELRASPGTVGLGYAAMALGLLTCRTVGDRAIDRWGARTIVTWFGAVGACSLVVGLSAATVVAVVLGFFGFGLGLGVLTPLCLSRAGKEDGLSPGAGVSGVTSIGWFGFLIGPPAIGLLAHVLGLRAALYLLPGSLAVITVVLAWSSLLSLDDDAVA